MQECNEELLLEAMLVADLDRQDYILPQTVYIWCGSLSADGDTYDHSWPESFLTRHEWGYTDLTHRRAWQKPLQIGLVGAQAFGLCELTRLFAYPQSSETHDKIHGFLGLASTAAGPVAHLDSDCSKSTLELIYDALRFDMDTGGSLSQLVAEHYSLGNLLQVTNFPAGANRVRRLRKPVSTHVCNSEF